MDERALYDISVFAGQLDELARYDRPFVEADPDVYRLVPDYETE